MSDVKGAREALEFLNDFINGIRNEPTDAMNAHQDKYIVDLSNERNRLEKENEWLKADLIRYMDRCKETFTDDRTAEQFIKEELADL